jgi:uncharacterized protein (DUF2267 family)
MATTGLEVFDRTLHTTNLWLDEINAEIGPDRHLAWHVLGAVLRSIRDEMQVEQSAHFAAQLPLLIRGTYFDGYRPSSQPTQARSQGDFIARIQHDMDGARPVNVQLAAAAVMRTLNRHMTEGQVRKARDALPKGVRAMWPEPEHKPPEHREPEHKEAVHKAPEHAGSGQGRSAEPSRPAAGQPAPAGQRPPQQASALPASPPQAASPPRPAPPRYTETPRPAPPPQQAASPRSEPPRPASPQSFASQHPSSPHQVHAAPAGEGTTAARKSRTKKRTDD